MKKLATIIFVLAISFVLFYSWYSKNRATVNDNTARQQIVITGSSTIAPLMSDIAKHYEQLHPDIRIDVQAGGSSRGIADTRSGLADFGMVSRSLKPDEQDLLAFTIARDGICIIVNSANPVEELSDEQIVAIYEGRLTNWQQVGGRDAKIIKVNKAEGRSTLELFLKYFNLDNKRIKADVIIGDNQQGIKTVAGNPNAIGYVSIGSASFEAGRGVPIKLLPMKGYAASIENVVNNSFPIVRSLNVVSREQPVGVLKDFIEFAMSEKVKDVIQTHYFVALTN
ncbi:MAG: phosphate ABC transporter substrate-binding protein [Pseudomonadota bacterium]